MKHYYILILLSLLFSKAFSQGAAINTSGSSAHSSAILDISSNSQGVLVPRMTEAEKMLIAFPANGLLIYQTNGITGFWYFDGSSWVQAIGQPGAAGATGQAGATGPTGQDGLIISGTSGQTIRHNGTDWVADGNLYNTGANIGIGTGTPDASAIIDISSNTRGTLITRLTSAERNTIQNPAVGLQIFNTDLNCLQYFNGNNWLTLCGDTCKDKPLQPSAISGPASPCVNSTIIYSVIAEQGITYTWQIPQGWIINNGQGTNQIDVSITTGSGVISVTPSSPCGSGTSTSLNISAITAPSHAYISGVTPSTNSQYTNRSYSVVQATWGGTGGSQCWLGLNLGATAAPTSATDNEANRAGWYFQFNRKQAYHVPSSAPTPSWTITAIDEASDWTPANDPCKLLLGGTWRLPTWTEWSNFFAAPVASGGMNSGDKQSAFNSALKLHTPGYLRDSDGTINVRGIDGFFWASNQASSTVGRRLIYTNSSITGAAKARGFSARCISD